ncbi:IS3 family transposase [Candidatus Phytoplasma ziziphi]|nr:IS3 family transposase [Candidatus Phytoplasma ziziphi]
MESFWSNLKLESFYLENKNKLTKPQVIKIIDDYIFYYNHQRRIKKNGYLSPIDYAKQQGHV